MKCVLKHYTPPCCPALSKFFFGCPTFNRKGYLCTIWCCAQTTVVTTPLVRVRCSEVGQPGVVFSFNFNQFVAPADQARVLLWTEY
jgi:hypothetical protein